MNCIGKHILLFSIFLFLSKASCYEGRRETFTWKLTRKNLKQKKNIFDRIFSPRQGFKDVSSTFSLRRKKKRQPELFEGDIVYDRQTKAEVRLMQDGTALFDTATGNVQWDKGIVPYEFDSSISYSTRKVIENAMDEIQRQSCIKFIKKSFSEVRRAQGFIKFFKGRGCYSYVGRRSRGQEISIGSGCEYKGTVIHELMHALGFYHEQSRRDRDEYITVNYNNIEKAYWNQFEKYQDGEANTFGFPYDLQSIMHYSEYAFSKNNLPTIVVKGYRRGTKFGQRESLSKIDLQQLNKYYKCPKTSITGGSSGNGGGSGGGRNVRTTATTITTTTTTTSWRKIISSNSDCYDKSYLSCGLYEDLCGDSLWIRQNCAATCRSCECKDRLSWCTVEDCEKSIYLESLCRSTCKNCVHESEDSWFSRSREK